MRSQAARNDENLHPAVRRERLPQLLGVDAEHEEVGVLRVQAEQLVANRAADEVRVEPQPANIRLNCLAHCDILTASGV